MNEGIKHDQGKRQWHLIPWDAVDVVTFVLEHGKAVHGERNWEKGMDYSRIYNATQRHLTKWWMREEDNDPDTHVSHLAHVVCNALFLLTYSLRGVGRDDRPIIKEINDNTKVQGSSRGTE